MLFKPDHDSTKVAPEKVTRARSGVGRRMVSTLITLLILGGLGYIGWTVMQQKQATKGGGRPENAQGAGNDAGKISEALAKARELISVALL